MTKHSPRNVAASVRQRLLNLARSQGEDFQLVLTRYGVERLLYRLSQSRYRGQFILKGAMLFQLWGGGMHRPTRDLDLLGQGLNSPPTLAGIFTELCTLTVTDDGLRFLAETVTAEQIKPDEEYQGIRVQLECRLENARIRLQVDIGYGDVVTPQAGEITFPTALDFPAPVLRAYPRESVVAEKLQAMVSLGIANSRMKDFYDIWYLAGHFIFEGALLSEAIAKTFERRQTPISDELPLALSKEFADDQAKQTQWLAFIRKAKLAPIDVALHEVVAEIRAFLFPVLHALAKAEKFGRSWDPSGQWT
ncbi:MAG: nucleotidyl transferase AbiEii/AbiGii toxin family protein [Pirellulales bacterium]|nr:nucleotidyl transferase AbiEii/AbiGii toxin family protein [Pirellulales bacterium]